jgi:hypothetical protein
MTDAKSLNFQTHLSLATTFSLCAETLDLYPQVRALVLEAEAASTNIRFSGTTAIRTRGRATF